MIEGWRLGFENVEASAGKRARRKRIGKCSLIDEPAAGNVDDQRRRLHQRNAPLVDDVMGDGRQRRMEADDVGLRTDRVDIGYLNPVFPGCRLG